MVQAREARVRRRLGLWIGCGAALAGAPAALAAEPTPLSEVEVVAPAPLSSAGIDPDKLPGVSESVGGPDFVRTRSLDVTTALAQRLTGVSLADSQGNGFTRELDFRGFHASPLQGAPEGLAVYMDGVRLNEAFGDTVNWDLIPQVAVRRAELLTSDPAFGLNALGGAISLAMKTGRDSPGGGLSLEGGSFGRVYGSAEYGASSGPWSVYVAADGGHEDGWRLHSPSRLERAYADLGWRSDTAEVHLRLAGAANAFGVVGPTPADLLASDERAVFTWPQTTSNRSALAALSGRAALGGGWTLAGDAYLRGFQQRHLDGNGGELVGCADDAASALYGTLCVDPAGLPAGLAAPEALQLQTLSGQPIACPAPAPGEAPCEGVPYGTLDRTRTRTVSFGAALQASREGRLLGRPDVFLAGASLDLGRVRFSADSTLGVIEPDLAVAADPSIPGAGQVIQTAGGLAYSPIALHASTAYAGLYAMDSLDLTGSLTLTVGARLNGARVRLRDAGGRAAALDGDHRFWRLDPSAGLAWQLAPALTLYGGYAEANRAPTPLELECSDPQRPCLLEAALVADPPLKQVVARTWEAGLRGRPRLGGGRLKWRLGVFQSDTSDDILALASALPGRGYYANVPGVRRRGVEAEAEYRSGRLYAYAGYSHVEASYRFSGALPSPNSPFADANGDVRVTTGDRLGGAPADRFNAGAEVDLLPALTLGASLAGAGPQYLVGDEANQDARLPGAWTLAVDAAWRLRPGLELFGRIDNLLDRRRPSYGAYFETDALQNLTPSPLPADPDPRTLTPAAPRAFTFGMRARW